jgi:hypothetical protein
MEWAPEAYSLGRDGYVKRLSEVVQRVERGRRG